VGEFELLARLRDRLPAEGGHVALGSGDDAAITVPRGAVATSVDALVEGVHFRRSTAPLDAIGHKALATALSDLAAMGAAPGEAYVALGVPGDLDEDGCLEVLDGLLALTRRLGVTLAGGDITASPVLMLAVTVVGYAPVPERFVRRGGAQAGELLVVTGQIGGAAAGLLLLEEARLASALPADVAEGLRERQMRPQPRLEAGQVLAEAGATAMIDISDGLVADARHLAQASGVGLRIDAGALPIATGVAEIALTLGRDPLDLPLGGGEDYELLAALAPEAAGEVLARLEAAGTPATVIGQAVPGEGVKIRGAAGEAMDHAGFDALSR